MNCQRSNNSLLLVLNPVAGKGKGKEILFETVALLTERGFRVTVLPTVSGGETEKTIAEECAKYGTVVAIGGDGTLNNVVNGIMQSGFDVPLGYIPLGSTNDFAKSLGLPKDIVSACDAIANNEPKYIDLGLYGERYFVYIACTGMFADTSFKTSQKMKNTLGHSAYLLKGATSLTHMKKMHFEVVCDGEEFDGDFILVAVSSTHSVGGVFKFPKDEVVFDDGMFELTLIKAPKNLTEAMTLVNTLMHNSLSGDLFITRKAKRVSFLSGVGNEWSLDGENGGSMKSTHIEIKEKALRFIY